MAYQAGQPPRDGKLYRCVATNRAYWEDDRKVTFEGMAKFGTTTVYGKTMKCWHDKNGKPVQGQIVRHWL